MRALISRASSPLIDLASAPALDPPAVTSEKRTNGRIVDCPRLRGSHRQKNQLSGTGVCVGVSTLGCTDAPAAFLPSDGTLSFDFQTRDRSAPLLQAISTSPRQDIASCRILVAIDMPFTVAGSTSSAIPGTAGSGPKPMASRNADIAPDPVRDWFRPRARFGHRQIAASLA